jgi:hypothetical protein
MWLFQEKFVSLYRWRNDMDTDRLKTADSSKTQTSDAGNLLASGL